jgi:hypothetical protein
LREAEYSGFFFGESKYSGLGKHVHQKEKRIHSKRKNQKEAGGAHSERKRRHSASR